MAGIVSEHTYGVGFLLRTPHPASHVGIDGEDQCLDQKATIEWDVVKVNCLGGIVHSGFTRNGEVYSEDIVNGCLNCETATIRTFGHSSK